MAITLRTQKGSELTFEELDGNFTDLNGRVTTLEGAGGSSKIELTDLSVTTNSASGGGTLTYSNTTGVFAYTPPDLSSYTTTAGLNTAIDGHLNTGTATANQILSWDGADYAWVADQTGGGGVLSLTGHAPAVNFDFTGDGSVFAADALDYAEFAGGESKTEASALASDSMRSSWSPISGAVYTNNQFGLYLMKGNANDALIESVGGSVNGWGDTILFGNVNDDGTSARMTSGLGITGNQVYLRTDGTEGDIKIRNTNANGNGEIDLFMGTSSTLAAYSRIKLEQDVITLAGFEANVTISDNNLGDLEIKKGTLGVSDAWVIGIDDANTVASSLVTFNVDGNSIWSATGTELTVNPTTTFNGAVNILGGNNLTVGTVGGAIIQVDGAGVLFGGATSDANTTTLTVTDPTAVRTITLPDASGTVALLSDISGGGASVTVQDTAPAGTEGDLWWESDVGTLKIYYDSTWVDASPAGNGIGGGGLANVVEDTTPQLGGDLDGQAFNITTTGKILYSNMYSQLADLPSATTYHGMFAHVHATGKAYYAHGGNWIELANQADIGGGGTWATLGDKDGANGPTSIVLGRNAIAQGPYGFALGNGALSDAYGMAFGMETQAAGYGVQIGAFSGKNHVATSSIYSVGIGSFTHQNANPGDETGQGAIALGSYAGDANQGGMAVALGYMAGRNNQAANSIVLNATGIELENLTPNSFVVKPIRQQSQAQALFYDPVSGEVTYDAAPGGGGSGLQSRGTVTGTTGSLADAAEADLDITGFKAYALLTITTDRAARVRLYVNAATRTADAARAEGVDPTSDAGVIAEVITTGADTVIISPGAYGFNLEGTPTTTIPCRVTNKSGGTSTVQVDLNILQLEA